MSKPRIVAPAGEVHPTARFCTCCERRLSGNVAWLELDQRDNTYHDRGGVPADKSQGWFPFGMTCAKKHLNGAAQAAPTTTNKGPEKMTDTWPKRPGGRNKKIGEMAAEESRAVFAASAKALQAEFEQPAVQAKLTAILRGENVNQ